MAPKPTTELLKKLRWHMLNSKYLQDAIQAYIIPSDDAHQSEYIQDCDKRRAFLTGFTGSSGTAVVTTMKAALWTDGRYFLQAESQLDGNWILMRDGLPSTPKIGEWLCQELTPNSLIGVDPTLMSQDQWKALEKDVYLDGHKLFPVDQNLIDLLWVDRPLVVSNHATVLEYKYTGKDWQDKVLDVREVMKSKNASALVVTALDDVAWLLNLRGSDISFNPVFLSYVMVTHDSIRFFSDPCKITMEVKRHFSTLRSETNCSIQVRPYEAIRKDLEQFVQGIQDDSMVWVSSQSSEAINSSIPEAKRLNAPSPIARMKTIKNETEIEGMRNAHVRDAIAVCQYFHWLEQAVSEGVVTEITGAEKLQSFRERQKDFVSLSFETISGSGPNGAIIHYKPTEESDRPITTEELYLCDSGAQYKDGTTDITRTIHLGTPSAFEQECFTRVLKGHINLSTAVFPAGTKGVRLDSLARVPLWQAGLDYRHGTGHGVGAFLNVHEGPCGISYRERKDDMGLEAGMILSNEPGYYHDGEFGIRIESLVVVKDAKTQHVFGDKGYVTFEPITLVPIQTKMINPKLLTAEEVAWLNSYHEACRNIVGAQMKKDGLKEALQWLNKQTEPLG